MESSEADTDPIVGKVDFKSTRLTLSDPTKPEEVNSAYPNFHPSP